MDVRVSQNIKIVMYKSVDVLKSGNVSMYLPSPCTAFYVQGALEIR